MAGFFKILVEVVHDEVDGAAVGVADEAPIGVLPHVKRQACVVVVVKRTQSLMPAHLEPQPFRDLLDGEVAEHL